MDVLVKVLVEVEVAVMVEIIVPKPLVRELELHRVSFD